MTPEIKAQLGLPSSWEPCAVQWALAKLSPLGAAQEGTQHVLVLDSAIGRCAFLFSDEEMRGLGEKITEQTTGLAVARTLKTNGGAFGR